MLLPLLIGIAVLLLAIMAYLIGCGGGGAAAGAGVTLNSARSVQLAKSPGVSADDYRWKDIAGNLYAAGLVDSFDYSSPTVTVNFDASSDTLQGTIDATGLKPNFAYQIKLIGKPTGDWGAAAGDDAANERIGSIGRWWSDVNGNVDDAYYQAHHATETIAGYLLIGFLITDEDGQASVNWRVENSYHVLWNTSQRAANVDDRPSQTRTLAFSSWGYSLPYPVATTETIYPEQEPTRATPGNARLAAGRYHCLFAVYEESFHDVADGAGPGGSWAKAMQYADLDFDVLAP
jgi:hypothetical protein